MNKTFKIFIDHASSDSEKDGLFAKRLAEKLKGIKEAFSIKTYADIITDIDVDYEWEKLTTDAIEDSNIIIPIISPDYLSFVSSKIEERFNRIFSEKDKYLFPILYRPADWASFNWLVRGKLIPDDDKALIEHSVEEIDKIINNLIGTIKAIITKPKTINRKPTSKAEKKEAQHIVFISHDHDDADFAELLKLQLEKEGIIGWIDSERLKIGQDWREEIDTSIEDSLAVIAIMTPEARKSEYVTYEWAFAWGKGKKIFPVMLKQTQLHPRLESLQYLDFTKRSSRPYESLIASIKEIIKKKKT